MHKRLIFVFWVATVALNLCFFFLGLSKGKRYTHVDLYLYCYNGTTWDRCREHEGFQTTIGPAQAVMPADSFGDVTCVPTGSEEKGWLIYGKKRKP
jgi:hypothetical protein